MLLVIIALMMATILTSAYLASRDNSAAIGANVTSAAAARWAADSGLEFGIAILETEKPWRTSHSGGRLVSNYPIAGGTVNIDLVDMESGLAPDDNTVYVRVTSIATVDGVDQTAVAECRVPLAGASEIDVDLSEFAVFAAQALHMEGAATIGRWPMAPLASLGQRVHLGTQATTASSIALAGDAASIDTTVFHGPGASAMLVAVAKGQPPETAEFLDQMVMPASPSSGVSTPPAIPLSTNLSQTTGSVTTTANSRWKTVSLSNTATRTLRGNITVVTDEDLLLSNTAKLVIDGQVKLVVFGDLRMDGGSIELKPNARLTMFVRGRGVNAIDLRDAYIGELRAVATRDATGKAAYMDPERVQLFSLPGGAAGSEWRIRDNTVVKASMYLPDAPSMLLRDTSAVYGRIAAPNMTIRDSASVFYDPSLDSRAGYTSEVSPIWDANKRLQTEVKTLVSLDASALQVVADGLGKVVRALTDLEVDYKPTGSTSTTPPAVSPTDPTPRTVVVETNYVTFGNALQSWE